MFEQTSVIITRRPKGWVASIRCAKPKHDREISAYNLGLLYSLIEQQLSYIRMKV